MSLGEPRPPRELDSGAVGELLRRGEGSTVLALTNDWQVPPLHTLSVYGGYWEGLVDFGVLNGPDKECLEALGLRWEELPCLIVIHQGEAVAFFPSDRMGLLQLRQKLLELKPYQS